MTFIQTYSGKKFSFVDPQPDDVRLSDIAQHLGKICRFVGACDDFYSVAQHSIFVSKVVLPPDQYDGLMHDAGEAYYGDFSRPLKMAMEQVLGRGWDTILKSIDAVISEEFNVSSPLPESVHHADRIALATERRDFLRPSNWAWTIDLPRPHPLRLHPMSWEESIIAFKQRYWELA